MSCPFKQLHADVPTTISSKDNGCAINNIVLFMQRHADAAFLLDHLGNIVYRNKAAQLMFLSNVNQMNICSLFSFTQPSPTGSGCDFWDDLAKSLSNSEPQSHDVVVMENDGELGFRIYLIKMPPELMGDGNKDVFACAYVTPAHDHVNGMEKNSIQGIAEECTEEDEQLEKHTKDVVQASLDPMFSLYENGVIGVANAPAVHLFGYSHAELVGKNIASICPTAREVQNVLNFVNAPSINKQQTTTAIDKSGRKVSIKLGLSLNQTFAGSEDPVYFAHMKDLTTLEEQKSQIDHKDTLCQAMINASFDPMFGIDQRGKIIVVNKAACQAFGYAQEEFLDNNISMICNESDARAHGRYLHRYVRTGEKRVIGQKRSLVARRKDGTEFPIELGVSEVCLSNGEKMFCGYVRDRTQEQLDKKMLRRKEAVIQDKFFQTEPKDARGAMKRNSPRRMQ